MLNEAKQSGPQQSFAGATNRHSGEAKAPPPAHVVSLPAVLLPVKSRLPNSPAAPDKAIPHYQTTLNILQQCNIPPEQMVLYEGAPMPADSQRQHPYRVIAIPMLEAEIAVSDGPECALMVSRPLRGRHVYTTASPAQIYLDKETQSVLPENTPSWSDKLRQIIAELPRGQALDERAMHHFAQGKPLVTEEVFAHWVAAAIRQDGHVPEYKRSLFDGSDKAKSDLDFRLGPLGSLSAKDYRALLLRQCRTGRYDEALAEAGRSRCEAGIGRDFTQRWLDTQLLQAVREKGRVPRKGDGQIPGADKGEVWLNVDLAFRRKERGLENAPDAGLVAYIHRRHAEGLFDKVFATHHLTAQDAGIARIELHTDELNERVIDYIRQEGRAPTGKSNKRWAQVENAFRRGGGPEDSGAEDLTAFLREQACLGVYDQALHEKGLSRYEAGLRRDFTLGWINGRLLAHVEEYSSAPGIAFGQIIGADRGEVWRNVDNAMRQKERGLKNSPTSGLIDYMLMQYEQGLFNEVMARKGLQMEPNLKQRFRLLAASPPLEEQRRVASYSPPPRP